MLVNKRYRLDVWAVFSSSLQVSVDQIISDLMLLQKQSVDFFATCGKRQNNTRQSFIYIKMF